MNGGNHQIIEDVLEAKTGRIQEAIRNLRKKHGRVQVDGSQIILRMGRCRSVSVRGVKRTIPLLVGIVIRSENVGAILKDSINKDTLAGSKVGSNLLFGVSDVGRGKFCHEEFIIKSIIESGRFPTVTTEEPIVFRLRE